LAVEFWGLDTIFNAGALLLSEGLADAAAADVGLICTGVAFTWLLPETDVVDVVDVIGADG
jgi:hypothetical protein